MKQIDLYYRMPYLIRYPIFVLTGALQAKNRYGRDFHCSLNKLMNNLIMSKDEIRKMQTDMMQQLLLHAYEHVPYYNRLFNQINFHL